MLIAFSADKLFDTFFRGYFVMKVVVITAALTLGGIHFFQMYRGIGAGVDLYSLISECNFEEQCFFEKAKPWVEKMCKNPEEFEASSEEQCHENMEKVYLKHLLEESKRQPKKGKCCG